jgi:predicted MFS family arabinose efflux permease
MPSPRSERGLDFLTFFVAGIQAGFGPFVAVHLTSQHWTQTDIGLALSIGGIVGLVGQIPGGILVDALHGQRKAVAGTLTILACAALLLVLWPARLPVFAAFTLQSLASCVLGPALAAISLALAGHAMLGERLGRNTRFAAIGNGVVSALMGLLGSLVSSQTVFWLSAAMAVPALYALHLIGDLPDMAARAGRRLPSGAE